MRGAQFTGKQEDEGKGIEGKRIWKQKIPLPQIILPSSVRFGCGWFAENLEIHGEYEERIRTLARLRRVSRF